LAAGGADQSLVVGLANDVGVPGGVKLQEREV